MAPYYFLGCPPAPTRKRTVRPAALCMALAPAGQRLAGWGGLALLLGQPPTVVLWFPWQKLQAITKVTARLQNNSFWAKPAQKSTLATACPQIPSVPYMACFTAWPAWPGSPAPHPARRVAPSSPRSKPAAPCNPFCKAIGRFPLPLSVDGRAGICYNIGRDFFKISIHVGKSAKKHTAFLG